MIQTRATIYTFFETLDKPQQQHFRDLFDSVWFKSEFIPIDQVTYGIQTLSVAPSYSITWDASLGGNAEVVLTGACTLSIINAQPGQQLLLFVKQDATGGRTLSLPTGSKVGYGGGGAVALTATANAEDIISIVCKSSSSFRVLINTNFT